MQETSVVAVAKKGCYGYYLCITICTGCGLASSAVLRIFSMHHSVFTVWFFVVLLLKIQLRELEHYVLLILEIINAI